MTRKPLPRRPAPFQDELLSSWIARLAQANYCSVPELCRYLGLAQERPPETQSDLAGVDIGGFCATIRLPPEELDSMLIQRRADFPIECISWSDFQNCPACARKQPGISLRHWRFAWSMQCEVCGSELSPVRRDPAVHVHLPTRLRSRATGGAKRLMLANRHGDRHAGGRMSLTLQASGVLAPELRHGVLFSQSRLDRFKALAAIDIGMTRPLLAVALLMKNDPNAVRRFRAAFPHKRKLVNRLASLAGDLPLLGVGSQENHKGGSKRCNTYISASPQPKYLEAAKLAIIQLGANADRGELLRYAESILQSARQRPVDIQ